MTTDINKKIVACLLILVASLSVMAESEGIQVLGTSQVSVTPDQATFSFSVGGRSQKLETLKEEVDVKTSNLIELCKKLGIKGREISSAEVNIRPQYDYRENKLLGYEVTRNVKVVLFDLSKYTDLVNGAIQSGVTSIGNIVLDTQRREELERESLSKAVEDAEQKATILAESSGVDLGGVISIQELGVATEFAKYQFKAGVSSQNLNQGAFEPGEIVISTKLNIKYSID